MNTIYGTGFPSQVKQETNNCSHLSAFDIEMAERMLRKDRDEMLVDWVCRTQAGTQALRPVVEREWLRRNLPYRFVLEDALKNALYGEGWLDLARALYCPRLAELQDFERAYMGALAASGVEI